MSATTVKLLHAASEIVGGDAALAARLGIGEARLADFMADGRDLPDTLLLRTLDIILAERQSRSQNCADESGAAFRTGPG